MSSCQTINPQDGPSAAARAGIRPKCRSQAWAAKCRSHVQAANQVPLARQRGNEFTGFQAEKDMLALQSMTVTYSPPAIIIALALNVAPIAIKARNKKGTRKCILRN